MEKQAQVDDLIPRAEIFRSKLIDSFQLLDSLQGQTDVPKYYSSELAESPSLMEKMMIEAPHGLVKFKVYSHDDNDDKEKVVDRRLNKVRMKSQFGIYCLGPWAKEITENPRFQHFMSALIVLNTLVLAIQAEAMEYNIPNLILCLDLFDYLSLVIFLLEIVLKLIDQPSGFWKNGWNIFDFIVTIMTLVIAIFDVANPQSSATGSLSHISILKGFRILRSLKMLTRFAQLRLIVLTILKAIRSIGVTAFLMSLMIYVYAVIGLIFFSDYSTDLGRVAEKVKVPAENPDEFVNATERFAHMGNSTLLVLQIFTVDNWYGIYKQMKSGTSLFFPL